MIMCRFVVLVCFVMFSAASALACSCNKLTLDEHYRSSSAVFIGKIISSKQYSKNPKFPQYITEEGTLLVTKAWKGVHVGERVQIKSELGPGPCGKSLKNNPRWLEFMDPSDAREFADTWLVFGYGEKPFELGMCTPSSPMNVGGDFYSEELDRLVKVK